MRKSFALTLTALLLVSLAANAMLMSRLATLKRTSQWQIGEIDKASKSWGMSVAERDFADGHPAWYVSGQFPNYYATNKPGRVVVWQRRDDSFVQAYNQRMDGLFAARQQPPISKP